MKETIKRGAIVKSHAISTQVQGDTSSSFLVPYQVITNNHTQVADNLFIVSDCNILPIIFLLLFFFFKPYNLFY